MLGWHKTFEGKSKLMQICTQLNRLASEYLARIQTGQYSDADKDTRSFEQFYGTVTKILAITAKLSNSILQANSAIFSHLQKYEVDFEKEAEELSKEEKTEYHIQNQLKVMRKLAHEAQKDYPKDERLERIYQGIVRLDVFFDINVKEVEKVHARVERDIRDVEELVKS